ncbi:MAG TPA: helix-turn-helix transcriptional regulator [Streptomyces sp.]|uniref:helix-turn-helix domain-containing protein n=1 Tax=Streptomyces sp. TaxID=1931 RepID=UPI002CF59469|nr:helix-turn-helix transcriptional regulator [Streptomyces sp.]HWU07558.1 helix-turn-helix transcriptional regulator [Streptomyces sp.]
MVLPSLPTGERVRELRRRQGRTQAAVAGLCGITTDYLSQIERGHKTPSSDVVARLAAELQVSAGYLLGDAQPAPPPTGPAAATAGTDVVRALLGRPFSLPDADLRASALRDRVEDAWRIWQTSPTRFTDAEALLPALIGDVEAASRTHRTLPCELREVRRLAADLYGLVRSYCRRTGRTDLALMVTDRALRAAEDADDPLRIAAARWNLGHALLSEPGQEADAADIAMQATDTLTRARAVPAPQAAALCGALHLVAVVAEARARRGWQARERLTTHVLPLARRAGEGNTMWTVFGPTNALLHAVSVEMTDGDATEALRLADRVDTGRLPSRERQFTFGLEVARCYDLRRDDAAVLVHLLELEALAPQDLQRSTLGRSLVISLMRRTRPAYRRQATALAERLHLL